MCFLVVELKKHIKARKLKILSRFDREIEKKIFLVVELKNLVEELISLVVVHFSPVFLVEDPYVLKLIVVFKLNSTQFKYKKNRTFKLLFCKKLYGL